MNIGTAAALAAAIALAAVPAQAQGDLQPRAAVSFTGGLGSGASETGIALGGSVLFDVTDLLAVEGAATYLDQGTAVDAFAASASLLLNFRSREQRAVPYGALGLAMYQTRYQLASGRFLGPTHGEYQPGAILCPAPGSGAAATPFSGYMHDEPCPANAAGYWGVGEMPLFYARRLGALAFPANGTWESQRFTDAAISVGGGLRLNISERIMLRPDARAVVIFDKGDTHTVGVFGVNVGYRF